MIDSTVSLSLSVGWSRWASTEIPKNAVARITPIQTRVVAAFRASGLRNAGTPLEMASTPVRATAPEENARMSA